MRLLTRDPGRQLPALRTLRTLPDPSPKARLKAYFSRACPQDDVSSTRQTPSNDAEETGDDNHDDGHDVIIVMIR